MGTTNECFNRGDVRWMGGIGELGVGRWDAESGFG